MPRMPTPYSHILVTLMDFISAIGVLSNRLVCRVHETFYMPDLSAHFANNHWVSGCFFLIRKKHTRGLCSERWPLFTPSNLRIAHTRRIYSWNILKFLQVLRKLAIGVEERNMNECFIEGKLSAVFCLTAAGSQHGRWLETVHSMCCCQMMVQER